MTATFSLKHGFSYRGAVYCFATAVKGMRSNISSVTYSYAVCQFLLIRFNCRAFCHYVLLIQAPSKDVVRQICAESYPAGASKRQSVIEKTANSLSVSSSEAIQVGSCHVC